MSISFGFPETVVVQDAPISQNAEFATLKVLLVPTLLNCTGTNLIGRNNIYVQNNSLSGIYIGNSNVSSSSGVYLASGNNLSIPIDPLVNVDIYAVAVGAPAFVSIMET